MVKEGLGASLIALVLPTAAPSLLAPVRGSRELLPGGRGCPGGNYALTLAVQGRRDGVLCLFPRT